MIFCIANDSHILFVGFICRIADEIKDITFVKNVIRFSKTKLLSYVLSKNDMIFCRCYSILWTSMPLTAFPCQPRISACLGVSSDDCQTAKTAEQT